MTQELKNNIENALILELGFNNSNNSMFPEIVNSVYDGIRNVQVFGSEYFENNTCFKAPLKNIVYKLAQQMKTELSNVRLAVTALGGRVVIGVPNGKGGFKEQHDITGDFIKAVIDKFEGTHNITVAGNKVAEIKVEKIK